MQNVEIRSKVFPARKWLSALVLVAFLLSALPGAILAKETDRATAQEDATPILLGEYVQQDMAQDDVATFAVYLPEEGDYMISPDDDEAAASFEAAIYDEAGESVYEGPLAMEAVALTAGSYTIEVTALDDDFLSFFVLGMIGGMSDSEREPGKLYPGSIYSEEDVSETRYATISIPDLGYPQEVLLYFAAGEGDSFYLSVSGETVSKYVNSDDVEMVRFYSEGGEYTFNVEPSDRRSDFSAIVFLSGMPSLIEMDGELEAALTYDTDTQIFRVSVDDVYDDVTITLTPSEDAEAELYMTVQDRYEESAVYIYGEAQDDGTIVASTGALLPGDYYVIVTSYDGLDTDFVLSAEGTPGAPMLALELGEAMAGTLEDGAVQYYRLDEVVAGTFVRITLSSDAEESDFDLHVGMVQPLNQWSSTATGPNEEVILVAPGDGTYYIQLQSYSGSGDYEVLAEEIPGIGLIDVNTLLSQSIDDDGYIVYAFAIDEPGQLLSVLLASADASDLDLSVVHYSPSGDSIHELSSISSGSSEIVSQGSADTGIYEVRVQAYGQGGDFGLLVRVEDPASLLDGSSQGGSQGNVVEGGNSEEITDDFSDPESGWAIDDKDGTYGYADGAYQITVEPGIYRWVLQEDDAYADISLEADIAFVPEDPTAYAGLVCRSTEDGYFYADISPAGDFAIGQVSGGDVIVLSEWAENEAIDTAEGAVNIMGLECIGDTISAYANGELLGSVTVEAVAGGYGFEAGSSESTTETVTALFDNLVVSLP